MMKLNNHRRLQCFVLMVCMCAVSLAAAAQEDTQVNAPQAVAVGMLTLLLSPQPLTPPATEDPEVRQAEMSAYLETILARYLPWVSLVDRSSGQPYADAPITGMLRVVKVDGQWRAASCKLYLKQLEAIAK